MATGASKRQQRERRIIVATLAICALLAFGVFAWAYGPAYVAYFRYAPQEGDIVFQSLPHSRLVDAIEGVSGSSYSHCGIVGKENGAWVVYEAFHDVEVTPLATFLFRGRNQGFAVYRLKGEHQKHVPALLQNVKKYLGRPYDVRYRMDDECIYCSELIYKAYRDTSGDDLGELVRLGDLPWRPHETTIMHFEGGPVPLDREMITPKDLAKAGQLERVFVHELER